MCMIVSTPSSKPVKSFDCPFCNHSFPLIDSTYRYYESSFEYENIKFFDTTPENSIRTNFYKCPNCQKISLTLDGISGNLKNIFVPVYPNSLARQFPEYIPLSIRNDYQEAYSILNLSPKASATLSRRCLQGMIRDFWGITKSRLIDEINALQSKVPSSQWKAIDSLRSIGNIGAHMEKDINTIIDVDLDESQKLLKLIELLLEKWYISRHDEEQLLLDISDIATQKEFQKQFNSNQ